MSAVTNAVPDPVRSGQAPAGKKGGLAANAVVYLAANVVNAAIPFLLLPLLTRVLPPPEYGQVALFQASVSLLAAFVGLNIHGAVSVQFFKAGAGVLAGFLPAVITLLAGSTVLTAMVIACTGEELAGWIGLGQNWLPAAVVMAAAQFMVTLRLIVWQLRQQPARYGLFQVVLSLTNMLLSIALVVVWSRGAAGRIEGMVVATGVFALAGLAGLHRGEALCWRWNFPAMAEALRFGLPLLPHAVGSVLVLLADRFIITRQIGPGATGAYFVAVQFALPLALIGDSVNRAFVPWLYSRLSAGRKLDAATASYAITLLFALAGLIYAGLVYSSFEWLVGPQYQSARKIVTILIAGGVVQASYYAFVNYIFYSERTGLLSYITVISGCLYVVVAWHVCGLFGTEALAWWFLTVQTLVFVATAVVAVKVIPLPWLAWRDIGRTAREWLPWLGARPADVSSHE